MDRNIRQLWTGKLADISVGRWSVGYISVERASQSGLILVTGNQYGHAVGVVGGNRDRIEPLISAVHRAARQRASASSDRDHPLFWPWHQPQALRVARPPAIRRAGAERTAGPGPV